MQFRQKDTELCLTHLVQMTVLIQQVLNICTSIYPRHCQYKQRVMRLMGASISFLPVMISLRVEHFRPHLQAETQSRVPAYSYFCGVNERQCLPFD